MKSKSSLKKPNKRRVYLRRVVGESMLPTLKAGQLVAIAINSKLAVGDIVMFRHDGLEKIKRLARLDDAKVYVLGDNPFSSTDSRQFGWIGREAVVGKIVWPKRPLRSID